MNVAQKIEAMAKAAEVDKKAKAKKEIKKEIKKEKSKLE
tara:strand:+ start:922 stop:1038 length:117 start_codon:yes stop_codon:yes gene_type:complete